MLYEVITLYFEAIANPTMKVPAVRPLVDLAHERGIVVICDNTFASPAVFRPLEWGVDLVVEQAADRAARHVLHENVQFVVHVLRAQVAHDVWVIQAP